MHKDDGNLWFDLDLAVMEDEALVVLAQECEFGPARDELIIRYDHPTTRVIGWLAHNHGLGHSDVEDARQWAVFWIVEGIRKYDTRHIGKAQGCSFRSFLHRVLIARFKDFAKHLRRVEHHYDRSACYTGDVADGGGLDRKLKDPASICEAQESMHRLQEALTCLDSESGRLWKLMADGISLRDIAGQLGMSYDSAKRRRRKLIDELKSRLNPSAASVGAADQRQQGGKAD